MEQTSLAIPREKIKNIRQSLRVAGLAVFITYAALMFVVAVSVMLADANYSKKPYAPRYNSAIE